MDHDLPTSEASTLCAFSQFVPAHQNLQVTREWGVRISSKKRTTGLHGDARCAQCDMGVPTILDHKSSPDGKREELNDKPTNVQSTRRGKFMTQHGEAP